MHTYARPLGREGGVEATNAPPAGRSLAHILEAGLPPWKVTFEILTVVAEILCIMSEDGVVHGQIDMNSVLVDEQGTVWLAPSIVLRHAPETQLSDAADAYGLGRVAYQLMGRTALPTVAGLLQEAHDDAVIDAVLSLNLDGLADDAVQDVQWMVGRLLSYDASARPTALEAWRSFIAIANALAGEGLQSWAAHTGGRRRTLASAIRSKGPLRDPLMRRGQPDGRPSTGMWTRTEVREGLANKHIPTNESPITGFWKHSEVATEKQAPSRTGKPPVITQVAPKRTTSWGLAAGVGILSFAATTGLCMGMSGISTLALWMQ